MLDAFVRPRVIPVLDKLAGTVRASNVTATQIIFFSFIIGIAGMLAIGLGAYMPGLAFLIGHRLLLGISGSFQRAGQTSPFENYAVTASRWIVNAGFVFFFAMSLPAQAMAAAFILFAYAALQAVSHPSVIAMDKPVYALGGLAEETEIVLFMILCCLFPYAFAAIAVLFGTLCIITVVGRLWDAGKVLR